MIGLTPSDDATAAELGFWLGRDYWNRGFTTEAAAKVVGHASETLRLRALTAAYFADNAASARVPSKLGFVETGRAMRPCIALGHNVASVELRLQLTDDPAVPRRR